MRSELPPALFAADQASLMPEWAFCVGARLVAQKAGMRSGILPAIAAAGAAFALGTAIAFNCITFSQEAKRICGDAS
jgi:hypothetical protein